MRALSNSKANRKVENIRLPRRAPGGASEENGSSQDPKRKPYRGDKRTPTRGEPPVGKAPPEEAKEAIP